MRELREHRNRGFTLIELVVVVSILGVIVAVAVPGVSSYLRSSRFGGAVNTLVADVHETSALARSQRRTYTINFNSGGYSIVQTLPLDTLRTRAMPRNVNCSATGTATFFPWGLTTPVNVTITDGPRSRVIRVSANGSVTSG